MGPVSFPELSSSPLKGKLSGLVSEHMPSEIDQKTITLSR
jgi:hypothetical protein